MRIAIIDDDISSAEILIGYIERFKTENGGSYDVKHFKSGFEFMGVPEIFDLVFMDIAMPHIDGLETARELRKKNKTTALIFVTNMAQYAIEGYEVDAMDFLVKPVEYFNFSVKLKKAIKAYEAKETHRLAIPLNEGVFVSAAEEISYLEVVGHSIFFHIGDNVVECRKGSLKVYEDKLLPMNFFRCNYCYLVNLKYITGFSGDSIFIGKEELKISKSRKKEFMKALNNYINGI